MEIGAVFQQKTFENLEHLHELLKLGKQKFEVLSIYPYLESYGKVKALLESKGQRIDDFDILIGVTAQQNNFTMVTANIKHLGRTPDLHIENWE